MRKLLTALTAFAVFATMALLGPDMAKADITEKIVIVYGQLDEPTLTVELTSPETGLPSPACDIDAGLAGCLSALLDELDCEIDSAAPPFSDTDQGGLVYTLGCDEDDD